MEAKRNPYDYLRIDCLADCEPIDAMATFTLPEGRKEIISITTAIMPDGYFVYGYVVHWAKGFTSAVKPSAERGLFNTQREAKLHAVGFMKIYLSYFLPETQEALNIAEADLLQAQLFD